MPTKQHTHSHLFDKAHTAISSASSVLVVMHQHPDGDALGSALSLSHYLDATNKPHDLFCVHDAPEYFSFLPHIELIQTNPKLIIEGDHTLLISLDSGDLAYAGIHAHLGQRTKATRSIINIDHHATNTHYGDINIVDPTASSTSELLYHFFQHIEHPISQEIATLLLTGIIMDTGGFSNLATTSSSLTVASDLLARGARIWDIQSYTSKNKPISALKVWGTVLSRLQQHPSGVVSTVLTQEDLKKHNATPEHVEGIANFLNSIEGARAIVLMSEIENGKIKVSLRSTQEHTDVSHFAQTFGGGGHIKASGFTIPGHIKRLDDRFHIT